MYAVAVTNKRIIVQNDKRCLFGDTPPTQSSMLAKLQDFFLIRGVALVRKCIFARAYSWSNANRLHGADDK
jgi:hypothetical protein